MPVGQRGEGGHLGDQPLGRLEAMRLLGDVESLVVLGGQCTGQGRHDAHRMGVAGELPDHRLDALGDPALAGDGVLEGRLLARRRQGGVQQEVAQFQEVRLLGELFDRVAAVQQGAGVSVDVGDVGVARGRGHESRVVGEETLVRQRADVDDLLAETRRQDGQLDGLVDPVDVEPGEPGCRRRRSCRRVRGPVPCLPLYLPFGRPLPNASSARVSL